jgi:WD40 repeat protein
VETLSWGLDEQLLVGSNELRLYSTYHNNGELVWSKTLANRARFAAFSYDTSLIATSGKYDRLVKIWRPLSLADQRFDYAYLPHPAPITGLYWHRPFHREQTIDNVLYTICADNKLRIWSSADHHAISILQLWDTIDLKESIQPRSLSQKDRSSKRYAFIIDNRDFTAATERVVQNATSDEQSEPGMAHLIEVATKSPDVCVVLDDRGNMSAWGLESVGCKHRKAGDVFNIAHTDGMKLRFDTSLKGIEDNAQFYPFMSANGICVLTHHFDGRLEWFEGRLDRLFDPSPQQNRLVSRATWTGHSNGIKKIVRSATGKALVSRTVDNESIVWTKRHTEVGESIVRKSVINTTEHIHRVWLLQEGRFVAFLHHENISIWDARHTKAKEVARRSYKLPGKPLCLLCVPEEHEDKEHVHLATITSEMKGCAWEVTLPINGGSSDTVKLADFGAFDLGTDKDVDYVLPVDPAGTAPVISGFLDLFARDVAISYSNSGVLKSWTARPDLKRRKLEWLQTSTVETLIERPSLGSATSIRKAALISADKTLLTIWNTRSAQLEYEEQFEEYDTIQDLDWLSTPDNQSILAVGFARRVIIYGQLRYDYVDAKPSWAPLREFNIRDSTPHPIGDSVWLGNGAFVIGAGNQIFVQDQKIDVFDHLLPDLRLPSTNKQGIDLFTVVSRLNGPLPVFHPQFLAQCILSGRLLLAQRILLKLWKTMKFYTDGEPFDSLLGFDLQDFSQDQDLTASVAKKEMHSSYADFVDVEPETVTEEVATALNEQLATRTVPFLTSREQIHLVGIIECVGVVEKHRRSMDENGSRFLLFFRQHALHATQHSSHGPLSWREITWAFFSGSQDILTDLVSRHFQGRMLWQQARGSGVFMWMTDVTALVRLSRCSFHLDLELTQY